MKKFIIKTSILVISIIFISFILQKFIDKAIKSSNLLNYQTWNDIIESKINSDLIIQGSSRARTQISPKLLDSAFKINSCNLGIDGTGFNMQYCRFQLLMKYNNHPKYIIQNVDCYSTLQNSIFQFEQYIPYMDNEFVKEAIIKNEYFDSKDCYLPLYKYTHSIFTKQIILNGIDCQFKNLKNKGAYDNYSPITSSWDASLFDFFKKSNNDGVKFKLDLTSIELFESFLKYCNNNNIKVIFVYAPEYIGLQKMILNRDSIVSVYRDYSIKYNTSFLDYSNDSLCLDKNNFHDSRHLNVKGVYKFNYKLINDLKSIIK